TALFGVATFAAVAGPQDRSVMPQGSYLEADNWGDIVCCKRTSNAEPSFKPRGVCDRHGSIVNNAQCRHTANTNSNTFSPDSGAKDENNRICWEKAGYKGWAPPRECRAQGGTSTNDRRCSNR